MRQLLGLILFTATQFLAAAAAPTVNIRNGTLVGHSTNGLDNFFGIPYARPPVEELRLRPPQSINNKYGRMELPKSVYKVAACTNMHLTNINLTKHTSIPADQQTAFYGSFPPHANGPESEDCLTLNIQRPKGTAASSKLPVLLWIYGGGFSIGSTQSYDGTPVVNMSMSLQEPIVYIAINYRVNAFGFLQGKELSAEGATNIGLRDQRKALEWVAENIEAFGGDPDRVTIWGESAGAISVWDHLTVNNGDNNYNGKALFHAGIMNSGSIVYTQTATSAKAQAVFDKLAEYAGCQADSYDDGSEVLDCLRQRSYHNFTAAMNKLPNFGESSSNDLAYVRRPDTTDNFYSQFGEVAARTGQYARVPVIMGNMQDEATIFTPTQIGLISNTKTMVDYFAEWLTKTPRKLIEGLVATYSTDPAAGLPAGTGTKYEIYSMSKRDAAIQSDLTFNVGRRVALSYISSIIPTWSYLATYMQGDPWWGTFHTADLGTLFAWNDDNVFTRDNWLQAYVHFVNFHNPNGRRGSSEWWPKWDSKWLQMANFSSSELGVTKDDFRWESYEYWRKHGSEMRM